MIRLWFSFRRNENRVDLVSWIVEFADLSEIDLADEESKDFIRLRMIFFDIDVPAEEDDILKRNGVVDHSATVLHLVISHIHNRIDFVDLFITKCTLLNFEVLILEGYLKSLTIFMVDLPVIVWSR